MCKKEELKRADDSMLGSIFCEFFMEHLRGIFEEMPKDTMLCFSNIQPEEKDVLCAGKKRIWKDSRIEAKESMCQALWWIEGKALITLKCFFDIIIAELEKRFSDLLYLEEVEKHLQDGKGTSDYLIAFFVGGLFDKEWIMGQYIRRILKERDLPSLDLLTQLSAQKYERRTVSTRMYFLQNSYIKTDTILVFDNKVDWKERRLLGDNLRTIRKLMEMSGKDQGLLILKNADRDMHYIEGLISPKEVKGLSAIEIRFTGHLSWEIIENEACLFKCTEGMNQIPFVEQGKAKWKDELADVMKDLRQERYLSNVESVLDGLTKQLHGTSIIFMQRDMLDKEVCRLTLYKRAYKMSFDMRKNSDKMLGISAIDGAILADVTGMCYCVGTILDGELMVKGDPGRGARYNSLINYVNWVSNKYLKKEKEGPEEDKPWCFVVVFSEDGMITIGRPEPI